MTRHPVLRETPPDFQSYLSEKRSNFRSWRSVSKTDFQKNLHIFKMTHRASQTVRRSNHQQAFPHVIALTLEGR
jgi:hypothetical protein